MSQHKKELSADSKDLCALPKNEAAMLNAASGKSRLLLPCVKCTFLMNESAGCNCISIAESAEWTEG